MIQIKFFTMLLIIFHLASLNPPEAGAEYNLATQEEELILISTEKEIEMGRSLSKKVEQRFGLDDDELLQKRLDLIGQNIAKVCDRKDINYHFRVLVGEDLKLEQRINAFALPGGYVYAFKDMIEKFSSDDEIASVLAHEVGHIAARHSIKRLQGSLGAMALNILTSGIETDDQTRARAYGAINLLMMDYSREDEFLADKLAVKYAKLAGYDPEGSLKVIDALIEIQRKGPVERYVGYRTHPYLAERKAMIRKEIHGQMDFDDFINMPE